MSVSLKIKRLRAAFEPHVFDGVCYVPRSSVDNALRDPFLAELDSQLELGRSVEVTKLPEARPFVGFFENGEIESGLLMDQLEGQLAEFVCNSMPIGRMLLQQILFWAMYKHSDLLEIMPTPLILFRLEGKL